MQHFIAQFWIESGHIYAKAKDRQTASHPVAMWRRLASATQKSSILLQ